MIWETSGACTNGPEEKQVKTCILKKIKDHIDLICNNFAKFCKIGTIGSRGGSWGRGPAPTTIPPPPDPQFCGPNCPHRGDSDV